MGDFLDRLDELIDRPCQHKGCVKAVPEASPSDDFCSERCEHAWRAANVGAELKAGSYGMPDYVSVPAGHPAEPTHRPEPEPGVSNMRLQQVFGLDPAGPTSVGLFQVMNGEQMQPYRSYLLPDTPNDYMRRTMARIAELYAVPPDMLYDPFGAPMSVPALTRYLCQRVAGDPALPDSVVLTLPSGPDHSEITLWRMWRDSLDQISLAVEHISREYEQDCVPVGPSSPILQQVREEISRYFRIPLDKVGMWDMGHPRVARRVIEQLRDWLRPDHL